MANDYLNSDRVKSSTYTERLFTLQLPDQIDAVEKTISKLQSLGVRVSPNCRISRFLSILKITGDGDFGRKGSVDTNARLQLTARSEAAELDRIIESLDRFQNPSDAIKLLRRIVKDPTLPASAKSNSFGRDAQEELLVASILQRGGAKVYLQEPDIVCHINRYRFVIAVKRAKSPSNWEQNLRKADEQIKKYGGLGVVALEISEAISSKKKVHYVSTSDEIRDACNRYADDFCDKHLIKIRRILDSKIHLGMILRFSAHSLIKNRGPMTTAYHDVIHFNTDKLHRTMAIATLRRCVFRSDY